MINLLCNYFKMVLRLRTFGLLIVALLLCSLTPISSLTDDEVYFEESGMEFGPLQNSTQSSLTRHKDLIPIHSEDIIGTVLVAAGLLVAASGGVGGGGILVPLYILVFGFHPKLAIALSNFTILGASIMNMALNFQKRHPFVDRPLVDWDVVAIMQPLTMAGTLLGAFFGLYLPDEVILLLLILLLSFTTHATIKKGLSQHSKESSGFSEELTAAAAMKMAMDKSLDDTLEEEKSGLLGAVESDDDEVGNISEEKPHRNEAASSRRPMDPELREILAAERHTPVYKVSILSIMFVGIIFLNVLKGGKGGLGSPVGITCGSFPYWSLTAGIFIWIAAFYWHLRSTLIEEWKCKKRLRYRYQEGDIEWTPYNTLYYPALCTIAGLFAGMFGIGGRQPKSLCYAFITHLCGYE